jgi:hypothetical protein
MTIQSLTLLGLTGGLVLLKLGVMAFALALVARALSATGPMPVPVGVRAPQRRKR